MDFDFLKEIKEPIFYVTNDVAKGIGLEDLLPNYHIVCLDDQPLVDYLSKAGVKVFCLERTLKERNKIFRSTSKVIDHPLVLDYIKGESAGETPQILFFKPSLKVDLVCQRNHFKKIGNSVELNRMFEDKVLFYETCLEEELPVPSGEVGELGKMGFIKLVEKYNLPLVVQFGRGWAGSTTYFIKTEKEFSDLQGQFAHQKVKITEFIAGKTILNNICLYGKKILVSPPAEQIKAVKDFTAKAGATCGRQWPAVLDDFSRLKIETITRKVGLLMQKKGYQGYFGLDFLVAQKTGRVYLSENNARLTASVPFFTKLELASGRRPLLVYHLAAFMAKEIPLPSSSVKELVGSEVVARNNLAHKVRVNGKVTPGTYEIRKGKLLLKRKDYYPRGLKNDGFWLTCAAKNRLVNPEMELIRAIFFKEVNNQRQQLDSSIIKIFQQIKRELQLEEC